MKNKLLVASGIVIMVLAFLFYTAGKMYLSEKKERIRFENNYISEKTDRARQQILTQKEFRKYEDSLCALAEKLKIKPKYITNVVELKYHYRDTVIIKAPAKLDQQKQVYDFNVQAPCYSITGHHNIDSVSITDFDFYDKIDLFLYKDYEKKYLFGLIKCGKYYTSKAYSHCKGDTIAIVKNIKIQ